MQCAPEHAWIRLREQCLGLASLEIMPVIALFPAEKVHGSSLISFPAHCSALFTNKLDGEKSDRHNN